MKTDIQMTFWGFNKLFEKNLKHAKTYVEAYEQTETYHSQHFGDRRFSCYDSFRVSRNRKVKNETLLH